MPKKKIADLPEITTVNANDLFLVEQSNGKNAYIKKSNLLSSFASIDTFVGTTTWGGIQTQANNIFYRFQFISTSSLPYRLQLWKSNDNKATWTMDKEYNLEKLFLSDGTIPMTSYLQVERANSNYFGRFDSNDIDTYISHCNKIDNTSVLLCLNNVDGIDNDTVLLKYKDENENWKQYRMYGSHLDDIGHIKDLRTGMMEKSSWLEACLSQNTSFSFFIVQDTTKALYNATDGPVSKAEYFVLVLVDTQNLRRSVWAYKYDNGAFYTRSIWNSGWLNSWISH